MKKVFAILFVTAMTALCLVPSASFADSGYGYTEAYDSFIVSEEYRTMAEEVDLVGMMKEKYPEMDGETLYRARYDAMQVAWEAIGSFADDLKKGEVTRNEKTLRFVSLTVPIVEDESGSCIASAQIDRNGEVEISLHPNGTIVTRQQYDESLCSDGDALPKGYTVLYFHYDIPEAVRKYLMVYTDHEILFYDLSFGWDETGPTKVPYTAQILGGSFSRRLSFPLSVLLSRHWSFL